MKVGDKLWFVPGRSGAGAGYVTIEKVGRLYLTLSNRRRADKHTLYADYSSRCYLSKEEHDDEVAFRIALSAFRQRVSDLREHNTDMACLKAANEALDAFGKAVGTAKPCPGDGYV